MVRFFSAAAVRLVAAAAGAAGVAAAATLSVGGGCSAAMQAECAGKNTPTECDVCAAAHQHELRAAGCTSESIRLWCRGHAGASIHGSFDGFVAGLPNHGHCDPCAAHGGQTTLTGWAVDSSLAGGGKPPVSVTFSIDGKPGGTVVANLPRPDLVEAGLAPNPDHGFTFQLPAATVRLLRTGSHTLEATVGTTKLPGPCSVFKCGGHTPPGPPPPSPDNDHFEYIQNADVKLGADLTRGGSIGFFSSLSAPTPKHQVNVINKHDMGREIQLSFYAGPNPYNPPTPEFPAGACPPKMFGPAGWPWNPIGAGDVDGNKGQVLNFTKQASSYHLVTRPLQWACHNVSCDCTFEQHVSLNGSTARIKSTVHMDRDVTQDFGKMSQELPAVYSNGPFYRLITYNGSKPWTGDAVAEYTTGFRGPGAKGGAWIPGQFTPTEHWAALVDETGFGIGVINFDVDVFLGGFSGPKGKGGADDPPTGYIAPVKAVDLPHKGDYTFEVDVVLGDVVTIRKAAAARRPN